MDSVTLEILDKVKAALEKFPEGEKFFDELDGQIIGNCSKNVILSLISKIPPNSFLTLSGGFGKKIADQIDNNELNFIPYILFKGGIRKGGTPEIIRFTGIPSDQDSVFLDDSIYGGKTFRDLQKFAENNDIVKFKLPLCIVIYDGCPIVKDDVKSLFRYYDHFSATPNYDFKS